MPGELQRKVQDELLNQELHVSLDEDRWRLDCDHRHSHSAVDLWTPTAYAANYVLTTAATPMPLEHSRIIALDALTQTIV